MSVQRSSLGALVKLTWATRIEKASARWSENSLLPLPMRLDKAFKDAGFRDVILENQELRKALKRA